MWVTYAVVAMLTFGGADFAAALAGRSVGQARQLLAITTLQQGVSLLPLAVAAAFVVEGNADVGDFAWAVAAGVTLGVSKPLFYAGLTFGSIVVFAPTTGVVSIVVPFTVSVARGEALGWLGFLGIAAAMPAVALVVWGTTPIAARWSMPRMLSVAFATGTIFGLGSLAIGEMGTEAGLAPPLLADILSLTVLSTKFRFPPLRIPPPGCTMGAPSLIVRPLMLTSNSPKVSRMSKILSFVLCATIVVSAPAPTMLRSVAMSRSPVAALFSPSPAIVNV